MAQTSILAKSLLICAVGRAVSGPVAIRVVSSAKINRSLSSRSFMLLMYDIKEADLNKIPEEYLLLLHKFVILHHQQQQFVYDWTDNIEII